MSAEHSTEDATGSKLVASSAKTACESCRAALREAPRTRWLGVNTVSLLAHVEAAT